MKVGIMQPYFLPYIGYWQLMNVVDKYVIYDDVNYINRGWINRNRILIEGKIKYFNIPVMGASQNKKINEIRINQDIKLIDKKLRTVEWAYKKAPYYDKVFPIIKKILICKSENLASYIENSIYIICDYFNIKTEIILSSSLNKNNMFKGQEKILEICEILGATEYFNAIGGQALYSSKKFKDKGIELKFLKSDDIIYEQFDNLFESNLSILDVMMFNSKEKIANEFLHKYTLHDEVINV